MSVTISICVIWLALIPFLVIQMPKLASRPCIKWKGLLHMTSRVNTLDIKPDANPALVQARVFPLPGTTYYNMLYDPKTRKQFYTSFKVANWIITPLYRVGLLPLIGFGKLALLLTTRGRKSGRRWDTPIGYFRYQGELYLISGWGKQANWYKNILAFPDEVQVQVGFQRFHARAELIQDSEELQRIMKWLVKNHTNGTEGKAMGWDPKRDDPETADFSGMFQKMAIVRLFEC
jgi:deazaflavin-dependent oxidoreductase (nitroreductase family)